jgi:hypothetical protein
MGDLACGGHILAKNIVVLHIVMLNFFGVENKKSLKIIIKKITG